jgi:hypothetical protein
MELPPHPGNAPHGAVKLSAPQASAAALMAPAEVPVMMGNGLGSPPAPQARRRSAIASSTPTW